MAQAELSETMNVDFDKLFKAITSYESYPQFVDGCTYAKIESRDGSKCKVHYKVSLMKDVDYQLDHVEDATNGKMSWTLATSGLLKKNTGSWELKNLGPGKTQVRYTVDIDFNFPAPGFVVSRLIKSSLPSMLKNFESFAKKL